MSEHLRHGTARPTRDTAEILRGLGLEPRDLAREVRKASPMWLEWLKLAPVVVLLAGGFAAAAVRYDRAASKDEVSEAVGRAAAVADQRMRALELELEAAEKELLTLRLGLDMARADAERRLAALEAAGRKRK